MASGDDALFRRGDDDDALFRRGDDDGPPTPRSPSRLSASASPSPSPMTVTIAPPLPPPSLLLLSPASPSASTATTAATATTRAHSLVADILTVDGDHPLSPVPSLTSSSGQASPSHAGTGYFDKPGAPSQWATSATLAGGGHLMMVSPPASSSHLSLASLTASPLSSKAPLFPDRPEPLDDARLDDVARPSSALGMLDGMATTPGEDALRVGDMDFTQLAATPKPFRAALTREETVKGSSRLGSGMSPPNKTTSDMTSSKSLKAVGPASSTATLRDASNPIYKPRTSVISKISLPRAPHLLPPSSLAADLPSELVASSTRSVAAVLLSRWSAAEAALAVAKAEVEGLEGLLLRRYGAGEGEVQRARVRAKADVGLIASQPNPARWEVSIEVPDLEGDVFGSEVMSSHPHAEGSVSNSVRPTGSKKKTLTLGADLSSASLDEDLYEAMSEDLNALGNIPPFAATAFATPSRSSLEAARGRSSSQSRYISYDAQLNNKTALVTPTQSSRKSAKFTKRIFSTSAALPSDSHSPTPSPSRSTASSQVGIYTPTSIHDNQSISGMMAGVEGRASRRSRTKSLDFRECRSSRTGSISSITSVGSVALGAGGGWGFGPWRWGGTKSGGSDRERGTSGEGEVTVKGKHYPKDDRDEGSGSKGTRQGQTTRHADRSHGPEGHLSSTVGSAPTTLTTPSLFSNVSLKSSRSSSPERTPHTSSVSTSPDVQSLETSGPVISHRADDSQSTSMSVIEESSRGIDNPELSSLAPVNSNKVRQVHPNMSRRTSESYRSPMMTALLTKWTPESSPAITTAALVQPSFTTGSLLTVLPTIGSEGESSGGSVDGGSQVGQLSRSQQKSKEFPHPPHFEAVAQSAAKWVSTMEGYRDTLRSETSLRQLGFSVGREVGPKVSEGVRGLLASVIARGAGGRAWDDGTDQRAGMEDLRASDLMKRVSRNGLPASRSPSRVVSGFGDTTSSSSRSSKSSNRGKGYLSSAKGTLGRAFGFAIAAASDKGNSTGVSPTSASHFEPNVTVPTITFRRLAPITPSINPILSTITLSQSNKTPSSLLGNSTKGGGGTASATTMELDTILAPDSKPPTLAGEGIGALKSPIGKGLGVQISEDNIEEPITDRYGFIVDVKSGVKLMRESRRKKAAAAAAAAAIGVATGHGIVNGEHLPQSPEQVAQDSADRTSQTNSTIRSSTSTSSPIDCDDDLANFADDDDDDDDFQGPTTALPLKSQFDVEAELDSLRETLGLPCSITSPADVIPSVTSAEAKSDAVHGREPTTQSVRRLLSQLNDMQEVLEKAQMDAWDSFIRKRKVKMQKSSNTNSSDTTSFGNGHKSMTNGAATAGSAVAFLGHSTSNQDLTMLMHDDNLIGVASMGSSGKSGREDWKEFKELVKKGIPIALRPRIWTECSGATERREPGYYVDLLSTHEGEQGQALAQIDCDVTRTLPTNVYFGGDGPGVEKLRRVLTAMSWHNPVVGYCQGMNMVASTLLLTLATEEDAFWVMACIIEHILPADYYTSNLLVSQADQRVFRDLVREYMPILSDHLDNLEIELPAITFGWFLSLFADALPIQTLLRIFDLFLIEGSVLLFRIALALLELNTPEIIIRDSAASLYSYMRSEMTLTCHNADKLVQVACDDFGKVKNKIVSALRAKHVRQLQVEMNLI